ncbi:MAG: RagB/SusD family nutrient uptake outer membrane protein [Tannerellaceae bacterium]|nr:RagB/SusD family nutrient uptake outer membrane protein [Tannerellaceae bacterium]
MKKIYQSILLLAAIGFFVGCADQLNVNPKGVLADDLILGDPAYIDEFVTPCYAHIPNLGWSESQSPWIHGSFRSDDAYKGGSGTSDQQPWHDMEVFSSVTPAIDNNDGVWYQAFVANSRYNLALYALSLVTDEEYALKQTRIGEVKFLRGANYLFMKTLWRYVPWVDEKTNLSMEEVENTPNRTNGTDDSELWANIIADLEEAVRLLPEKQSDKGRADKNAARAMLAKALLFSAYEQDDRHQVKNINKATLEKALVYLNEITAQEGTGVNLCPDFAENFLPEYDNNTPEAIWELQYSIYDNTSNGGNVNAGTELNAPSWEPYFPCCDFHKPSYNMANAFRTDANGLPMFDTFNDIEWKDDYDGFFNTNTFDPRFSHTIAVPGQPFKYDPNLLYEMNASRSGGDYGYMKSMKEQVHPDCDCIIINANSMNVKMIRYAEVLLWKAEILIQLDRHMEALPIINQVRQRAAESTGLLVKADGTPVLDYKIGLYTTAQWTKEYAWKALMFENRLETACEGRRFFDLQRWGILESTMNDYFRKERTRFPWMNNAIFVAGRDEYKPIPNLQINWSKGNYTQNPGY